MSDASSHKSIHTESTTDKPKVHHIQFAGDGNEFVIINNRKYYRHELQSAFGGFLNNEPAPYNDIMMNPAPVGLSIEIPNLVFSLGVFYGGMVQFVAGLFEFITGNTFGLTVLTSYGSFWISLSVLQFDSFGVLKAYKDDPQQLANANGLFMVGWVIFTIMVILVTMKTTVAFCSLFVFLDMTFILLAAADFTGHVGVKRAGGVFGVITSFIAWYNAFVGTADKYNSYITGYAIPLPGNPMFHDYKSTEKNKKN
ncbi:hypothetical protein KGF54_000129 [Candida jiufengensis]|uniref:uncharacterized protein n=1 Tax=Candida jiufengensis TaxID=497108 RepID=UPI0022252CCA|nr:uncharacterized protein KGF54_000129 [Candida jiufengensis]KAI5957201.1 hypothetical protein KGF54_000129 [Candida jiufengensis]